MWTNLDSSEHIEFYESFGPESQELFAGPMRKAVKYLQSLPTAKNLFAFTSHAHFQVTTSPSISEEEGHWFVGLIYDAERSEYRIYLKPLSEGWASDPDDSTYFSPSHLQDITGDFINRLIAK